MKEQVIDINALVQDDHNFNKGTEAGRELMEKSFKQLGAGRSVLIDKDGRIIAGNKSQKAAIAAGIKKVRIIETTGDELVAVKRTDISLDSKEGRELALADNLTTQVNLAWDEVELDKVAAQEGIDLPEWGIDLQELQLADEAEIERKRKEFADRMANGENLDEDEEYQAFKEKFEQKKTTDDCYTPELVYEAVADWVANEYGLNRKNFVRPFYPGGDYQKEKYPAGCVVVDNPPFSILPQIIDWYNAHGIRYFLFGPQLTLIGTTANRCAILPVGVQITYANGANVNTSFATNLEAEDIVMRAVPELFDQIERANKIIKAEVKKQFATYIYDKHVIMSPLLHKFSRDGVPFVIRKGECIPVAELDAQKGTGTAIFGKGYLVSDKVLERREKAEQECWEKMRERQERNEREKLESASVWELSDREKEIIKGLK